MALCVSLHSIMRASVANLRRVRPLAQRGLALILAATVAAPTTGCGASVDAPEGPPVEDASARRPRPIGPPRSEYATCVVALRSALPDPDDFGAGAYAEAMKVETRGDFEGAITAYAQLIAERAGSKLVPYAYFGLGVLYAHMAETDPDRWIMAERSFTSVQKYGSDLDVVAWVELGKVFNKRTKWTDTLSSTTKAADRIRSAPATPCAEQAMPVLADELVSAFAETGDPSRAFTMFKRFYGPMRPDDAVVLTEKLALLYEQRGESTSASSARASIVNVR